MTPTPYNKTTSSGTFPFTVASQQPLGVACNAMPYRKSNCNFDLLDPNESNRLFDFLKTQTEVSPSGCWLWTGRLVPDGYGKMYVNGKQQPVHRLAYLAFAGSADSLVVRHKCDVRNCWNLRHLETGTQRDNVIDCVLRGRHNSGKTELRAVVMALPDPGRLRDACIRGHAYTSDNVRLDHSGYRRCRTCCRINRRKHRAMAKSTKK